MPQLIEVDADGQLDFFGASLKLIQLGVKLRDRLHGGVDLVAQALVQRQIEVGVEHLVYGIGLGEMCHGSYALLGNEKRVAVVEGEIPGSNNSDTRL